MSRFAAREFLGRGSVYTIGTVAPILVTLLITPLVVRLLGTERYGYIGIAITTYQAVSVILPLGLPSAVTRHALIEKSGRSGAAGLVVAGAGLSLLIAVPVALTSPLWGTALFGHVGWLLVWPVISAVGLSWMALGQSMLRADDRARTFVSLGWLMAIIPPASALTVCAAAGPDVARYLMVLSSMQFVVGLVAVVVSCRGTRPRTSVDEGLLALRIAIPTVPHQFAMASLGVAIVAVATSVGGVAVGGWAQLAYLLGTAVQIILGAVNNAWAPMVYRASRDERMHVLASSTAVVSLLGLALTCCFVLAVPVLAFVVGNHAGAGPVLQGALVGAAGAGFMILYLSNVHLVFVSGKTSLLALATPASFVVAVGAAILITRSSDVAMLSLSVVPVFYALQYIASIGLRHAAREPRPHIHAAVPAVAAGILVPLLAAVGIATGGDVEIAAVVAAVVAAIIGGALTYRMWRASSKVDAGVVL